MWGPLAIRGLLRGVQGVGLGGKSRALDFLVLPDEDDEAIEGHPGQRQHECNVTTTSASGARCSQRKTVIAVSGSRCATEAECWISSFRLLLGSSGLVNSSSSVAPLLCVSELAVQSSSAFPQGIATGSPP